jgi:DNA-binding response OmpR family regulator
MQLNTSDLDFANKTIVIIEDDVPSVKYYETVLRNTGVKLAIFHTGKEFIDYLNEDNCTIDLVFIDFLIPFINGIDCTRIFRKLNKNTPVIMITAYYSDQVRKESFLAGCNEFVLKPVFPEKILFLLEKHLRSKAGATVIY